MSFAFILKYSRKKIKAVKLRGLGPLTLGVDFYGLWPFLIRIILLVHMTEFIETYEEISTCAECSTKLEEFKVFSHMLSTYIFNFLGWFLLKN